MGSLGTQLDVKTIVANYVAIRAARIRDPLVKEKKDEENQISMLGKLKGLLTTFEDSFKTLQTALTTNPYQATTTDSTTVTINYLGDNLAFGTYDINVTQLAQAQKYDSVFMDANTIPLEITETLVFTNNEDPTQTYSVDIEPTDTLEIVRAKINGSGGNIGVNAVVISSNDKDGNPQYNLELQSTNTGTVNAFTVTGDTEGTFGFTESQPATDAEFTFNDFNIVRSSNTVDDVIDGLSFNLLKMDTPASIIIDSNQKEQIAHTKEAIKATLTAFNDIIDYIDLVQANPNTRNNTFTTLKASLLDDIEEEFNNDGDISTLLQLGIRTAHFKKMPNPDGSKTEYTVNGELEIESRIYNGFGDTRFNHQLETNFDGVVNFFNTSFTGFIAQVSHDINTELVGPENGVGIIASATKAAQHRITQLDEAITTRQQQLDIYERMLSIKWAKLNALLDTYDKTGSFMDQQFGMLKDIYKR